MKLVGLPAFADLAYSVLFAPSCGWRQAVGRLERNDGSMLKMIAVR